MRFAFRMFLVAIMTAFVAALPVACDQPIAAGEKKTAESGAEKGARGDIAMEKATFGAGCFWGVEATFQQIEGVTETAVGFMGGTTEKPSYKEVCTGRTGHAEVVHVTYDPSKVKYEQLLDVFWKNHDPTQMNRQGPDVGTQYRSVVFYHTPKQEKAARESKAAHEKVRTFDRPIATVIEPAGSFWRAEEYHQKYLQKRGLVQCH